MIHRILADSGFQQGQGNVPPSPKLPQPFADLLPCLTRAPDARYDSAMTMADDFSDVMERLGGN